MKAQPPSAPTAADLDFKAAIEADAEVQLRRLGFDDRIGRKRLLDLVHEAYVLELMTIAQMVRWFEIGLVTPQELNVVHPTTLMIDLRQRIAASPSEHVRSPAMGYTLGRMMTWWQHNTVTSAWRSLKAHVRVTETSTDLADALADFLWNVRDMLSTSSDGGQP
ncbi:MAG: hypothetical protein ACKO1M_02010 [Planctomycetota bacterium]